MPGAIDLNDIRLLMQVVEHGSYTAASRAIGVPKSTISQRIAALERLIGTGLLRRTSRAVSLTEAGSFLLPHARAIEELARKVEQALLEQGDQLAGTLRLSCCNALSQFVVSPLVPRFLQQHPGAAIRVEATNRVVDLVGEGYDMALRTHAGRLQDSTLLQRIVGRSPWSVVAARSWIDANDEPSAPDEISPGQVLCFSTAPGWEGWTLRRGDEEAVVAVAPRLICDDIATLRASALAGGGLACLPSYAVADALRSGALVRVLADWSPASSTLSVLTPPRAQSSRLARAFSDFLAAELPLALDGAG